MPLVCLIKVFTLHVDTYIFTLETCMSTLDRCPPTMCGSRKCPYSPIEGIGKLFQWVGDLKEGYRMVLEKSWVLENFSRVSKSRRSKLESRNLELAKYNARLGESFNQSEPSQNNGENNSKAES